MSKRLIISICLVAFLLSCKGERKKEVQVVESKIPVKVMEVESCDLIEYVSEPGLTLAHQEAKISSEVMGKVNKIFAEVGDVLKVGDPIFKLDDEKLLLGIDSENASFVQLQANYDNALKDYNRQKILFKEGTISKKAIEDSAKKVIETKSFMQRAIASLKKEKRDLRVSTIKSPINGILAERKFDIGTNVFPQAEVATVSDISKIRITIGVSDMIITKVHISMQATISIDSHPGKTFDGSVITVGKKANSESLTFPVEIEVDNPDLLIADGMFARVKIKVATYKDVIAINTEYIIDSIGGSFVYIVENSIAKKIKIEKQGKMIDAKQMVTGLSNGQLLVVSGHYSLTDGTKVNIVE